MSMSFWAAHSEAIISAVVGIVFTYVVSWYFTRKAARRKYLGWQLELDESLLGKNAPEGIKVTYDGTELSHPRVLSINVFNLGNRGIAHDDYTKPIEVKVQAAKIQSAKYNPIKMAAKDPVEIEHRQGEDTYRLTPPNMNPGDFFNIRFVVDGDQSEKVSFDTTIFEQTSTPRRQGSLEPLNGWDIAFYIAVPVTFIFFSLLLIARVFHLLPAPQPLPEPARLAFTTILVVMDIVVVLASALRFRREWRRRRIVKLSRKQP
jgi:hypothetical protein